LSDERRVTKTRSSNIPAYIVTFSDMVTLLLTFFVMLLSLANVQDEGLFGKGRDSFLKSVKGFGLGILYGKKQKPDFGHEKIKYFIRNPDRLFKGRSIHAKEEEIRRVFQKVDRSVTTMPSKVVSKKTNFAVTDIRFLPGDATLNKPARRFLTEFCSDLQQGPGSRAIKLCVLGLAGDEASEKEQWILSARRAQAVAEFLRGILSSEPVSQTRYGAFVVPSKWPIYSWGAGPGGDWVGQDSPISRRSQILIAVLRANE